MKANVYIRRFGDQAEIILLENGEVEIAATVDVAVIGCVLARFRYNDQDEPYTPYDIKEIAA